MLGRALNGSTSMHQLGEALWINFQHHFPASAFVLYGYDEATDAVSVVYKAGRDTTGIGMAPIPLGDRLSGWVAATAQTVMNSDARLDLDDLARERTTLRSALAVPITANGRPAGVLSFYASTSNAFDDAHRRLAEAASRAAAGSIAELLRQGGPRKTVDKSSQDSTRGLQNSMSRSN